MAQFSSKSKLAKCDHEGCPPQFDVLTESDTQDLSVHSRTLPLLWLWIPRAMYPQCEHFHGATIADNLSSKSTSALDICAPSDHFSLTRCLWSLKCSGSWSRCGRCSGKPAGAARLARRRVVRRTQRSRARGNSSERRRSASGNWWFRIMLSLCLSLVRKKCYI